MVNNTNYFDLVFSLVKGSQSFWEVPGRSCKPPRTRPWNLEATLLRVAWEATQSFGKLKGLWAFGIGESFRSIGPCCSGLSRLGV